MAAVPPQIPGLVGWRPLARGGFATVWEAKQLSLNRLVAVKVDRRTLESDSEQRRFLREAGAAGRMSGHPGIVTVHDAGILTDDRPYLVMALCEGGSLTKWVKGEPRPSQEEVREVGVRIADALAATHERGVLHRDVKPANILIDSYGHAGLADFGLAALPDPGMELSETLEAITPAYAPPEVFHRKPPTEAGDVYSLGATLYAVLAGRPPRWPENGDTPNVVDMFERLDEPIDRIPGVDERFMDALLASLASDPEDRPSAAEFRDRLKALPLEAPAINGRPANGTPANGTPVVDLAAGSSAAGGAAAVGTDRPSGDRAGAEVVAETPAGQRGAAAAPPGGSGPPEELRDDAEDQSRSRRRAWILAAAIAVILALTLAGTLANMLPDRSSGDPGVGVQPSAPVTAPATAPGSPEPEPTRAVPSPDQSGTGEPGGELPPDLEDCSDLGANVYCVSEPECWMELRSYADAPRLADEVSCEGEHLYQTYVIGELDFNPRRQSSVDVVPQVKAACRPSIANSRIRDKADRRDEWDVYALPPQTAEENFFRCIFGYRVRTGPIALK